MSEKSVFCIATSLGQASRIVDQLKVWKFSNNDISVLFPDKGSPHDFAHKKHSMPHEDMVTGASAGSMVGGALGWIAGIGTLTIPGVGPFIAAGPIMAALSGAAVGAAIGSVTGGLIGLGIPEIEAKHNEVKIKASNLLISVHAKSAHDITLAKDIFKQSGAENICSTGDASKLKNTRPKQSGKIETTSYTGL